MRQEKSVNTTWRRIRADKVLYLMLLPVMLNFIIFHYLPMVGIVIAFKNYHPAYSIWDTAWVGFDKFKSFFQSYYFVEYTLNTLRISIWSIIVGFPMPILLALLVNEIRKSSYKRVVQTVTYMPYFISSVIVVGLLSMLLNPADGVVNRLITAAGGETVNFLGSTKWFVPVYIGMGIWQGTGFGAVVYLSAISGIDSGLYEAAILDGAGRFARMWHITIKSILPTIAIMFILRLGGILNVGWMEILLMQNTRNAGVSEVIQTFVYKRGIINADYSYSTAVGLMMSGLGMIMILLSNFVVRKLTHSEMSLF